MELSFTILDWVFIGLLFVALLVASLWGGASDENEENFLLSGRRLTLPAFVATLVSTWYGGILGVGEYSYQFGISQWLLFGVPYYGYALLFAIFLAKKVRQNPALSIPEALSRKYGRRVGRWSALPVFVMVNPAPYVFMLSVLFGYMLGGEDHVLIYAIGVSAFAALYVVYGGLDAVVRTDIIQIVCMFLGFMALLFFAMQEFGPPFELWQQVPSVHRDPTGGHDIPFMLVWFFIALWTFIDPGFHQRAAAARTPGTARKGIFISIGAWMFFDCMTVLSGMYSRVLLGGGLEQPVMAYPYLANEILPWGFKGMFFVSLLATIMSTLDSDLFLSGQTLGRDFLRHWFRRFSRITLTRLSVIIALILSVVLIYLYPSVVSLWYVIGSTMIPGLLIPVMGVYFPFFAIRRGMVIPLMVSSISISVCWLVMGALTSVDGYSQDFLGIEPIYTGLATSLLFWYFGRISR